MPNGGPAGTEMTCSLPGPLARGAVANDLVIPVTPLASGELSASANVRGRKADSSEMPDAVLTNNTGVVAVTVEQDNVVNLSVTKAASPTTLDQADGTAEVTYTITPKRVSGAEEPQNVTITDELPARITSYSFVQTDNWTCNEPSARTISCSFTGTAPAVGATYPPVRFKASVNAAAGGTVENTAKVSAKKEDSAQQTYDTSTAVVSISNTVNLNLSKAVSKSPIKAGEAFNWTLAVHNQGSLPVKAGQTITVVDHVPAGIQITGFSNGNNSQGWSCTPMPVIDSNDVTCTNSEGLQPGSTSAVVLAAKGAFDAGQASFNQIVNKASLTGVSGRESFNPIENSASVNVSEHQVDIGISKAIVGKTDVESGDEVTYQLTVTNHDSTNPSTGIVVTDVLQDLVTSKQGCTFDASGKCKGDGLWPDGGFISATVITGTGTCSANGSKDSTSRTVTCQIPTLEANANAVIEIKAMHYANNENGSNLPKAITNEASVRSTEVEDPTPANDNSNTVTVNVKPITDIQVFKTANPEKAAVGEPVIYTLQIYNAGPSYASSVSLKDALPANAHWIEKSFKKLTANCAAIEDDAVGDTLDCDWTAPLAPNQQLSISYALRATPTATPEADMLDNTVEVDTETEELSKDNNKADAQVALKKSELDLVINMQHTDDSLVLGKETEYTITVTNTGPSYATQVKITDAINSTLAIGANKYPSSATFSYQGITAMSSSLGSTTTNLLDAVDTLCQQPSTGSLPEIDEPLVCTIGKLAPDETITIKFRMQASDLPKGQNSGTIYHNAKVELFEQEYLSSGNDTDANNYTSDRTSARRTEDTPDPSVADLRLTKEADSEESKDSPTLNAGDALTYTLTVTNLGPENSPSSLVQDTLPEGLVFVSAPGCEFDEMSRLVSCDVGALAVDEVKAFNVETTIASPYTAGPLLSNSAQVIAEGDPNPSNNEDKTTTKVYVPATPVPSLSVFGMLALIGLMAGFALLSLRRRA